jgi:two-component system phosphate regulon response regulator PhoB
MTSFFWFGGPHQRESVREQSRQVRPAKVVSPGGEIALACPATRRVVTPAGEVHLSPREWALLAALVAKPGITQARTELLHAVWGPEYAGTPRVVDVRVGHLRRKLRVAAGRCIETVHGSGYRFAPT